MYIFRPILRYMIVYAYHDVGGGRRHAPSYRARDGGTRTHKQRDANGTSAKRNKDPPPSVVHYPLVTKSS